MTEKQLELFEAYRGYIIHEDNLIANRVNWLTVSQPFLFASYSFSLSAVFENGVTPEILSRVDTLLVVVCMLGAVLSLITITSVFAAFLAMRRVKIAWERNRLRVLPFNEVEDYLPELTGGGSWWAGKLGGVSGFGIPVVSFLVWLFLLARLFMELKVPGF